MCFSCIEESCDFYSEVKDCIRPEINRIQRETSNAIDKEKHESSADMTSHAMQLPCLSAGLIPEKATRVEKLLMERNLVFPLFICPATWAHLSNSGIRFGQYCHIMANFLS